jgi:hypothetical protein
VSGRENTVERKKEPMSKPRNTPTHKLISKDSGSVFENPKGMGNSGNS